MKKRVTLFLCLLMVMMLLIGTGVCMSAETSSETKIVEDMAGRKVEVAINPRTVATMQGPSYEQVFMLGAKDQIGLVRNDHPTAYPLAVYTNPELQEYPVISGVGPKSPINIEEFIDAGVDMVIYWPVEKELRKFENAGIPAIVINHKRTNPQSIEEAVNVEKRRMAVLAEALGGNALERYKKWKNYYEKNVELIKFRTSKIPEGERPVVYWGNTWGENILSSFPTSNLKYEIKLCGGKLVGVNKGGKFTEVTKEQLLAWEPEVIIVDNHGGSPEKIIEQLKTKPLWAELPAVKSDRLYRNPAGVFFIDKGSSRAFYYLWVAKKLNPDLFSDINLVEELKYYYKIFYDYDLNTDEAKKVLAGWHE